MSVVQDEEAAGKVAGLELDDRCGPFKMCDSPPLRTAHVFVCGEVLYTTKALFLVILFFSRVIPLRNRHCVSHFGCITSILVMTL